MFSVSRTESLKTEDCFIPVLAEFLIISDRNENDTVRDRNAVWSMDCTVFNNIFLGKKKKKKLTIDKKLHKVVLKVVKLYDQGP